MTDQLRDLDEIDVLAARLYEYATPADAGWEILAREDVPALLAEVRRLRAELAAETAPFHLHSATAIADADNPTQLRWGLDDVMWGDDDSITVLLSGPTGEPYWLELEPERVTALRESLAGPDEEQLETVHGCPPEGSGLTPCCGRTPFELPLRDRISSEAPTTCTGQPASV